MSSNRRSSLRLSASQPTLRSCSFQGPPFWARSYPASPENHETKHHLVGPRLAASNTLGTLSAHLASLFQEVCSMTFSGPSPCF